MSAYIWKESVIGLGQMLQQRLGSSMCVSRRMFRQAWRSHFIPTGHLLWLWSVGHVAQCFRYCVPWFYYSAQWRKFWPPWGLGWKRHFVCTHWHVQRQRGYFMCDMYVYKKKSSKTLHQGRNCYFRRVIFIISWTLRLRPWNFTKIHERYTLCSFWYR